MSLSADEVRKVAELARLELSDADVATMARQLSAIVDYINQLQSLNTDNVEPMAHALDVHDVFRADEPVPSLSVDEALANAPARKGDFYSVPPVFGD
ncbi:MAG TPA: Asp-tRNA(Asn)/Glu-tRNA(Gln) amidotransferase subunit GatC [Gemmataceae bacterium]|nr:Asp-tRNA(Asn)/Glu-tRNA(Gln) amidotransferase subunit GatC [Gemmataceae bacterium]